MITLKGYQQRALGTLRDYFRECSKVGSAREAFDNVQRRRGMVAEPYLPVLAAGLAREMPYVCLRVPTGGGKTLMACHAAGIAIDELLHADRAVVLWLVPSNTILDQTIDALRDVRHPYRHGLEEACGPVEVVSVEEALRLARSVVDSQTVVIVATIQSFRVEDTTGRKVYDQNGAFAEHLLNIPENRVHDLLPGPDGKPKPSLVNMLRLRRPVVLIDEAHNARTDLSFSTLGGLLPSCIVEFTATPAREGHPSNILHHVSAAELKAGQMVKLPLRVVSRHPSQRDQLLADAISTRAALEKLAVGEAQQTGEYLRPILLLQAERVDGCEEVRQRMVSDFSVPLEQIKISVGANDELKDVEDIASPRCPVRFIITVQKLREGWDCPFAYVLCSLKETRSATAIEQLVGRVLRLPKAQAKVHPDLNCAYAFSISPSITTVLAELREALESNGFTTAEAERIILPAPQGVLPLGVQPQTLRLEPNELDSAVAEEQVASLFGKARFNPTEGAITIVVPLDTSETERLASCGRTPEAKARIREAVELVRQAEQAFGGTGKTRTPSPYERRAPFRVPLLGLREDSLFAEFDSTHLLEVPWKLSAKDAALPDSYDPSDRPVGKAGVVDVGGRGEIQTSVLRETPEADFVGVLHQHVLALRVDGDWTLERLVGWLDQHIEHRDIPAAESAEFLRRAVRGVMARCGIQDIGVLVLDRFRLRDAIEARIDEHRLAHRKEAFQQLLLDQRLDVGGELALDFEKLIYEPAWVYEGGFQFQRHYFGPKPGELKELTSRGEQTEEFKCAQFIDDHANIEFWVRNIARRATSFRLQTSKDWFYPDFVCKLKDGRVLAVEYKGAHLYSQAEEKRMVGAVWQARSQGKCIFVMPKDNDLAVITAAIRSRS